MSGTAPVAFEPPRSDHGPGPGAAAERLPALGPRGEGWILIQTTLAVILLASAAIDPFAWGEPARTLSSVLGAAICLAGIALFAWGARTLGRSFSVWVSPRPGARLVTTGPYAWTRNPLCTAQSIFGVGWALMWGSPIGLGLSVVYALYLDRGKLAREEETLLATYPEYRDYMRRVTHRMWPVPPRRRGTVSVREVTGAAPGA